MGVQTEHSAWGGDEGCDARSGIRYGTRPAGGPARLESSSRCRVVEKVAADNSRFRSFQAGGVLWLGTMILGAPSKRRWESPSPRSWLSERGSLAWVLPCCSAGTATR